MIWSHELLDKMNETSLQKIFRKKKRKKSQRGISGAQNWMLPTDDSWLQKVIANIVKDALRKYDEKQMMKLFQPDIITIKYES